MVNRARVRVRVRVRLRAGHLVNGDVAVSPGATASEAPARRPEGDARVILAAAPA